MARLRISTGGQVSIPSEVRRRWGASELELEDLGDRIVLRPATADPVAEARGALAGGAGRGRSSAELRLRARRDDAPRRGR